MDEVLNTMVFSISNININQMLFLIIATVPFLLIYLIITLIYFKKIDVRKTTIQSRKKREVFSTTRQLMKLFFLLFFVIIVSLIVQFTMIYIEDTGPVFNFEYISMSVSNTYSGIPFNIIVNAITACTLLFGGAEMSMATIATIHSSKGVIKELPENKRKRVAFLVFLWLYISIIASFYHFLVANNAVNFYLDSIFVGLSTSCVLLFAADKAPGVLKDVSTDSNKHDDHKCNDKRRDEDRCGK